MANPQQRAVFDAVCRATCLRTNDDVNFSYRSNEHIAIAVTSTGLAALTLHVNADTILGVRKQSHIAALLREADFFVWDDCSMIHKDAIDTVDRMLQDICSEPPRLFGGKTFLFSVDFKQT
ncbi:hypothetical protein SPRG_02383 [Saprolegnia parasitica CBS 223.65]|uniref:ATP-dependent DNA helicase n=1 Tax=Saprolegnia parasitica (strain CBS 223.65) TaxID=695850 RepID=A0A067CQE1_SAPPC|nr:hypothetical protein SPRG_02383 [Saprolegnia parasitica CBS 223.65]KDO32683.1 hypothetical protein SPRG_02383 [Saprolegnia parasitica CBS 223.65]|eukprot:XP_012196349.1 hypothetical protein SPRG_02383 [Saprolegnia parasitica CBS 223.65]